MADELAQRALAAHAGPPPETPGGSGRKETKVTKEPEVGDYVSLTGHIAEIDGGVALVKVVRTYPVGGTVSVQCGALEHIEVPQEDNQERDT